MAQPSPRAGEDRRRALTIRHDRTHHRRQGHRGGAARQGRGRGETPLGAARPDARARGRAGRQQSGERVLCRQQGQGDGREPACARSTTACRTRVSQAELLALVGEAQRRSGGARHPGATAAAQADRRAAGARRRSIPRKDVDGFHPVNAGRLASGLAGAGALHAARLRHAGEDGACLARRPRSGGDRPLQHRRQAGGAACCWPRTPP